MTEQAVANPQNDSLGTGRRKSSVARVRVRPGSGQITINGKELTNYFPLLKQQNAVTDPLNVTGQREAVDVLISVSGGGVTGQADACKLGIARALKLFDAELEPALRDSHLLTRDGRAKERKKPGLRKARRATQFSKR